MSAHRFELEIGKSVYGARLLAVEPIKASEVVYRIEQYKLTKKPTYQTIQVGPNKHLKELGVLAYLNHSCRPNVAVNTQALTVFACRDIAPGDELSFFYPSTEWKMDRPFACLCGAPECIRLVAGAIYVPLDVLSRYFINDHIREMAMALLQNTAAQALASSPDILVSKSPGLTAPAEDLINYPKSSRREAVYARQELKQDLHVAKSEVRKA